MMRRLLAALGALILGGALLAATPQPAQARSYLSDGACWSYDFGLHPLPYVCMEITYLKHTGTGGHGMFLHSLHIYIVADKVDAFNDGAIMPCNNLRIWNDADVVKWRRDSDSTPWAQTCELTESTRSKTWPSLDIDLPNTDQLSEGWTFDANMKLNPDKDDRHIGLDQFN